MKFWDWLTGAMIRWAEWRNRRQPGYVPPCEKGCQKQHIHMPGAGYLFVAPLGETWPSDKWVPLGAIKDGGEIYEPVDGEEEDDA